MSQKTTIITAIGTPLREDESLHVEGLARQLDHQFSSGIDGVLVAGTMGLMQLLSDETYRQLIAETVRLTKGRGEIMAGAGDNSFARTRDRIRFLNECAIDGVAVLPPHFIGFSQEELIRYYRSLADISRAPIYLYDQPVLTGTKLQLGTVLQLAEHPNIRGIKCSDEPSYTRRLVDGVNGRPFRVIMAQPDLIDVFVRFGIREQLDGIFSLCPEWVVELCRNIEGGKLDAGAERQRQMNDLRTTLIRHGLFPAFTVAMNERGIPGNFAALPYQSLSGEQREKLLAEPVVQQLLS